MLGVFQAARLLRVSGHENVANTHLYMYGYSRYQHTSFRHCNNMTGWGMQAERREVRCWAGSCATPGSNPDPNPNPRCI